MSCCKAKEYGDWCSDLLPVYTDRDGNQYCAFHAPREHKYMSFEIFNKYVFERIQKAKDNNKLCNLIGTIFPGDINLGNFIPLPEINFSNALFAGKVDFSSSIFKGNADFSSVIFEKEVNFRGTRLELATFLKAMFKNDLDFMLATFKKEINFTGTIFEGETMFWICSFEALGVFVGSEFKKNAHFHAVTFEKGAEFMNVQSNNLVFANVNLKQVVFRGSNLINMSFINCDWQRKFGRNMLYDEVKLFQNDIEDKEMEEKFAKIKALHNKIQKYHPIKYIESYFLEDIPERKYVEALYRQLKRKYKTEHNEPEVSNWHYGEKEMFRKSRRYRRYVSLSWLYWLSSGYSERPFRAGVFLLVLILIIALLLGVSGLSHPDTATAAFIIKGPLSTYHNFWTLILATLQFASFVKEPLFRATTSIGQWLELTAHILIPLQTALFLLAVRNKFRR